MKRVIVMAALTSVSGGLLSCTGEIVEPGGTPMPPTTCTGTEAECATVDFARDIQPILADYCVRCHGGVRELGALNLQTRQAASHVLGCAGCPPESSPLYARTASSDPNRRMPLGAPAVPAEKLEKLRLWVEAGAPWETHWSYRPIEQHDPERLRVSDVNWASAPLDRFLLARLDAARVQPAADADAATLMRRVTLDLTGLPPTPEEVDAFASDPSPPAFESVVDRLLSSPAFGERWGRHWLDQARYSDSDGYEKDSPRWTAWRYRDWVIDAFNADLPFDEFTVQQLAGDLLPSATPLSRLATAFHTQTLLNTEGGIDPEEDRVKRVVDRTATVGNVWLGLSLQCAQCHGHPYDRVSQREFFGLFAFFDRAEEGTAEMLLSGAPDAAASLEVSVLRERAGPVTTQLLLRGNYLTPDTKAGAIRPSTPAALHPFTPRGGEPDRLDLARWLIDPANPLTARVRVNTIWYHLFGRGLVDSLADFGARGELPSHPELLDWLAHDLVQNGWRQKRVIRQIVLSRAYRQSSRARSELAERDPSNQLHARQFRRRLEAEAVFDNALAVGGLLQRKLGGPGVFPPIPEEFRALVRGPYSDFEWVDSIGEDRYRRSLYTFHKRSARYPSLQLFDWPAADVSVNGRPSSNSPLQALATLHDSRFLDAARGLARRVRDERPGAPTEQLRRAFRWALAREASGEELALLESLSADARALYAASPEQAALLLGLASPGDDAADQAALVTVARVILNLDEFLTRE